MRICVMWGSLWALWNRTLILCEVMGSLFTMWFGIRAWWFLGLLLVGVRDLIVRRWKFLFYLYEVFISLLYPNVFYLVYRETGQTRWALGICDVGCVRVLFLLWYTFGVNCLLWFVSYNAFDSWWWNCVTETLLDTDFRTGSLWMRFAILLDYENIIVSLC